MRKYLLGAAAFASLAGVGFVATSFGASNGLIGVNVVFNSPVTQDKLNALATFGKVRDRVDAIQAVTMQARESDLNSIRSLPFVASASPDAERKVGPEPAQPIPDTLAGGLSTWDLDAINVTESATQTRLTALTGSGVYVAVLDTGLLKNWRYYFPPERIATQYGASFGGGGGEVGTVSTQPNKWESDTNSHGTHVTSSIIGYDLRGAAINGVAPGATVIPVKVLNQNGSGWSSVIARGIVYVADLKTGPLANAPVVINMSLGGPQLDAMEKAAIDYAIARGVIIVAAAGNEGEEGMGYPGAYAPVISVAAAGWEGEWTAPSWWRTLDVADPTWAGDFYITDFSSREKPGQQLDVAAPGSWVVGPYQVNGQQSYFYLGGTSMASPHVAGLAALMLQKNSALTQATVESILKSSALFIPPGALTVNDGSGGTQTFTWGADATGRGLVQTNAALAATP